MSGKADASKGKKGNIFLLEHTMHFPLKLACPESCTSYSQAFLENTGS